MLQRLELDAPELQTFLTHDASARSIYKLYPGRSVQAATDEDGNLIWLRYIHTPGNETDGQVVTRMLHVAPAGNSYKAEEITESTDRQTRVAVGTIRSSLFGATDAAGIPDSVTLQMADILSAKIDFLRDLRQGDQFRVVYEVRSHDGRYAGAGRVLALEFINGEDLQRRLVQPRRQERLVLRFRRHQPARRLPSHRPEVQPHQLDLRHAHAPHPQDLDGAQGRGLRRAFGHADPFHG